MKVDVIIATYDRHDRLARCLAALQAQTYKDFKVLVIDDNSQAPVAASLPADLRRGLDIRVVRQDHNGGPARARNLGVRLTAAEFILFIDDDVVADPALISRHLHAAAAGPRPPVQFGPLRAPADWCPTAWNLWEARTLGNEYDRMEKGIYPPTWRQFFTGNAFLLRSDFESAGGFNETFRRAEDIELAYRMHRQGCRFSFVPEAIGWHYADRSLASWLDIPHQYARFDVEIDRLHPGLGWMRMIRCERQSRHLLTRVGASALRRGGLDGTAPALSVSAARLLHKVGARKASLPLLSFTYALVYERSLRSQRLDAVGAALADGVPDAALR